MATYKNQTVLDYPAKEIFKVFKLTAKRDFPKFNENKPIGVSVERKVGAYSLKTETMLVKITDYKNNEVYEITSSHNSTTYKSRYEFFAIEGSKTKLVLIESQYSTGFANIINIVVASIFFRGRVKKRFNHLVNTLKNQIEDNFDKGQEVN